LGASTGAESYEEEARVWTDVTSKACLAGQIIFLPKAKFILFYSRVIRGL